jgi:hypothetical protein
MIIDISLKNIKTFEPMKIVKFFCIIWEKWSKPEFLRSWSRTKMDRLRNTGCRSESTSDKKIDKMRRLTNSTDRFGSSSYKVFKTIHYELSN